MTNVIFHSSNKSPLLTSSSRSSTGETPSPEHKNSIFSVTETLNISMEAKELSKLVSDVKKKVAETNELLLLLESELLATDSKKDPVVTVEEEGLVVDITKPFKNLSERPRLSPSASHRVSARRKRGRPCKITFK